MTARQRCPHCGSKSIVGHRVRTAAVLFWQCLDCGDYFHRWPKSDDVVWRLADEWMTRYRKFDRPDKPEKEKRRSA